MVCSKQFLLLCIYIYILCGMLLVYYCHVSTAILSSCLVHFSWAASPLSTSSRYTKSRTQVGVWTKPHTLPFHAGRDRPPVSVSCFVYLYLSTTLDLPSARPSLQDKDLSRYPISYAITILIFKYILAPLLIVWISISVFVRLTHQSVTYDPSSCTHDEIRESSTTFDAEESASRITRRDPYYDLVCSLPSLFCSLFLF